MRQYWSSWLQENSEVIVMSYVIRSEDRGESPSLGHTFSVMDTLRHSIVGIVNLFTGLTIPLFRFSYIIGNRSHARSANAMIDQMIQNYHCRWHAARHFFNKAHWVSVPASIYLWSWFERRHWFWLFFSPRSSVLLLLRLDNLLWVIIVSTNC